MIKSESSKPTAQLTAFIKKNPDCVLTIQDAGNVDIDDQLAILMLQKRGIPNIIVCGCDGKKPSVSKDLLQKFGIEENDTTIFIDYQDLIDFAAQAKNKQQPLKVGNLLIISPQPAYKKAANPLTYIDADRAFFLGNVTNGNRFNKPDKANGEIIEAFNAPGNNDLLDKFNLAGKLVALDRPACFKYFVPTVEQMFLMADKLDDNIVLKNAITQTLSRCPTEADSHDLRSVAKRLISEQGTNFKTAQQVYSVVFPDDTHFTLAREAVDVDQKLQKLADGYVDTLFAEGHTAQNAVEIIQLKKNHRLIVGIIAKMVPDFFDGLEAVVTGDRQTQTKIVQSKLDQAQETITGALQALQDKNVAAPVPPCYDAGAALLLSLCMSQNWKVSDLDDNFVRDYAKDAMETLMHEIYDAPLSTGNIYDQATTAIVGQTLFNADTADSSIYKPST